MRSWTAPLLTAAVLVSGGALVPAADARAAEVAAPLLPREAVFSNPTRAAALISPDGQHLSWLAPDEGVLNIWVAPVGDLAAARVLTADRGRGVRNYGWAANGSHLIYVQDRGGDENFRAYAVEVASGAEIDLTPIDGVRAEILATSWDQPNIMMIGLNDRDPAWHDVYRIDVTSGERTLVYTNTDEIGGYTFDHALNLRLGERSNPDGSRSVLKREGEAWAEFFVIPYEDALTTAILGFDGSNAKVHALESLGRDTSALVLIDVATGARTVLGSSTQADVAGVMTHPTTHAAEAFAVNYLKNEWTPIGDAVAADLEFLRGALPGEVGVASRSKDDQTWVIANGRSDAATVYHLFDRSTGTLTELFSTRPELADYTLAPMRPIEITSRDGLPLVSYLTLPPGSDADADGRPESPVPLVLNVHGGPWARDGYGFNAWHQWLSNRGYAVLSVNFRASTGFGKAFVTAGDNEWGRKMHDDLLDGVNWAVENGITTADKVAITGGSYGGYATLAGLTFTPDAFACGVSIVGPSNLETLLATIPPYWASFFEQLARAVGDPRTEEGRALLAERSPLNFADNITRPLLIGQGANDPRVKQAESDQIVSAMQAKNLPVTYVLFPDEGHGFARPENRLAFYAVMESFLAGCLGGRFEPVGDDFAGSSLTAPHGAEFAPGLTEALEGFTPETRG